MLWSVRTNCAYFCRLFSPHWLCACAHRARGRQACQGRCAWPTQGLGLIVWWSSCIDSTYLASCVRYIVTFGLFFIVILWLLFSRFNVNKDVGLLIVSLAFVQIDSWIIVLLVMIGGSNVHFTDWKYYTDSCCSERLHWFRTHACEAWGRQGCHRLCACHIAWLWSDICCLVLLVCRSCCAGFMPCYYVWCVGCFIGPCGCSYSSLVTAQYAPLNEICWIANGVSHAIITLLLELYVYAWCWSSVLKIYVR